MMISSLDGGGSERQTVMLANHLDRRQFVPELLVLRRGGVLESLMPADVPVHCLTELAREPKFYWPGAMHRAQVNALRDVLLQRQIDVIYDRTFHMSLIAAPAAKIANVPRVSTIVSPPSYAVPLNAGRFLWIKRQRLAAAYRSASRVVAVSSAVAHDAKQFYGLRRPIDVVLNPVDLQTLQVQAARPVTLSHDSQFTMLCVGRMSQEKGHRVLLDALAYYKQLESTASFHLILLGDGPLRSSLEDQTVKLGIADQVTFAGHLETVAPYIATANLLVLPSLFEGFPNVVLEAMALKTPVLASDLPVIRQLGRIGSSVSQRGFDCVATFECGNAEALAKKIQRVRLNSTAQRSRVNAAYRLIENSLCLEAQVPRLEHLLLAAASSGPIHVIK